MFSLNKYLRSYWLKITLGLIFKALEVVAEILTPFLVSKIIDIGIANNDKPYIFTIAAVTLAINIAAVFFALIAQKCSSVTAKGVGRNIRRDLFAHINTFSHAELDKFNTTTLVNRTMQDVSQIDRAIGMTIRLITRAPILLIGSLVMSIIINAQLSLIFLVAVPIICIAVFIIMKRSSPLFDKTKVRLDKVTNVTRDNLGGIRVVRAFNKQADETDRFLKANDDLTKINLDSVRISSILQPLLYVIINFAVLAILYFGGIQVNIGNVQQGDLIAFINYFSQISMALVIVARIIIVYTKTGASIKRVKEVFETQNSLALPQTPYHFNPADVEGNVEFKNVSFSYGSSKKNAINDLSFTAFTGDVIGVIGGTGSGKSTIVNLIPRFYDATSGEVLVNGVNVKDYDPVELRDLIGFVPQNNVLFEGTLEENLRWRKADATEEELIIALKIAQAYDFVKEKPDFLKTRVLRNGSNFSGGQKQRLCIARALVGKPKILVLDDSSSALDFQTDFNLRKAIRTYLKNTTLFIVGQRTNSIKFADNIIVMDNGNVVDIAPHDVLIKRCDVYKEIYNSQNKKGVK